MNGQVIYAFEPSQPMKDLFRIDAQTGVIATAAILDREIWSEARWVWPQCCLYVDIFSVYTECPTCSSGFASIDSFRRYGFLLPIKRLWCVLITQVSCSSCSEDIIYYSSPQNFHSPARIGQVEISWGRVGSRIRGGGRVLPASRVKRELILLLVSGPFNSLSRAWHTARVSKELEVGAGRGGNCQRLLFRSPS